MSKTEIAMQITLKAIEVGAIQNNKVTYEDCDMESEKYINRVCKAFQTIYNTVDYAEDKSIQAHLAESKN